MEVWNWKASSDQLDWIGSVFAAAKSTAICNSNNRRPALDPDRQRLEGIAQEVTNYIIFRTLENN